MISGSETVLVKQAEMDRPTTIDGSTLRVVTTTARTVATIATGDLCVKCCPSGSRVLVVLTIPTVPVSERLVPLQ